MGKDANNKSTMNIERRRQKNDQEHELIEDGLRQTLNESMTTRLLQHPLTIADAEKFVDLHFRCFGIKNAGPEKQGAALGTILHDTRRGKMISVMEYAGEGLDLQHRSLSLEPGDWVGYLQFKRSGFFDPETLEEVIKEAEAGNTIQWESLTKKGFPPTFSDAASLETDAQDKAVAFLEYASIVSGLRGLGLSTKLLQDSFKMMAEKDIEYVVGYARMPHIHHEIPEGEVSRETLEEYGRRRDRRGLHPDPGIGFHQQAGSTPICVIPGSAPDDEYSRGNGMLITRRISGVG